MFDLAAYLNRIRHAGPREPSLQTLAALCAAHPAAIPFENLDPFLGRAPLLTPAALQAKLVGQRRGGYCFEQNALLRLALLELGMQVTSLAARVLWNQSLDAPLPPRSHMLLLVQVGDAPGRFLVDAGFGGHLIRTPLRFEPGLVQVTPTGTERIVDDGGSMTLETELPGGWQPVYRFTLEHCLPQDYEPLNWWTATRPQGLFPNNLRMERLTAGMRASLLNDKLTLRPAAGSAETRRIESAEDLAEVLDRIFDIEPPVPAGELFARLPTGLDGPWIPPAR